MRKKLKLILRYSNSFIFIHEDLKTENNEKHREDKAVKEQQEAKEQQEVKGAVPLSLRCKALSSVSMRGNSSLEGQLKKKQHAVKKN